MKLLQIRAACVLEEPPMLLAARRYIVLVAFFAGAGLSLVTHSDAFAGDDLCGVVETNRAALLDKYAARDSEANPLKKETLNQEVRQLQEDAAAQLGAFFDSHDYRISNATGTVTNIYFNAQGTEGPFLFLTISLPCEVNITFNFIDPSPAYQQIYAAAKDWKSLAKWQSTLETINENDRVKFSGYIVFTHPYKYPMGRFPSSLLEGLLLQGTIEQLEKH